MSQSARLYMFIYVIFEKVMARGPQKRSSHLSDMQMHKRHDLTNRKKTPLKTLSCVASIIFTLTPSFARSGTGEKVTILRDYLLSEVLKILQQLFNKKIQLFLGSFINYTR